LRSEGKDLPSAILRGISGDRDVVPELERLLDDADPTLRRKSAELLFELGSEKSLAALRLALFREEDAETRQELALALTRWGENAGLTYELLRSPDVKLRRRAALALGEQGDSRGAEILVDWFRHSEDEAEVLTLLSVFSRLKLKASIPWLVSRLTEVRLRPAIARTLGEIGDGTARPVLLGYLMSERYVHARPVLVEAVRRLGGKRELASPLVTYLGMPEPLPDGLQTAIDLDILSDIGGPNRRAMADISRLGDAGVRIRVTVPAVPKGHPREPVRLLVLGNAGGSLPVEMRVEPAVPTYSTSKSPYRSQPPLGQRPGLTVRLEPGPPRQQLAGVFPGAEAGTLVEMAVYAPPGAKVLGLALVPEREEFPAPPPVKEAEKSAPSADSRPE
jgi:hypothetical protein